MKAKRILSCSALVFGALLTLAGMTSAAIYMFGAVLARLGEPDQSLLFWYLPFLFLGVLGILVGLGIGLLGAVNLRNGPEQRNNP